MALADYHEFQIKTAVKEAEIGIGFSELENELGGGFYSQLLYGSENGERFWRLTLPTLSGSSMDGRTVLGINNETLNYEEYLWDLFCEQKVHGTPFAYRCPRNGNYYLVRFAQPTLSYQRMLTKLYSTGIELKQWRIEGETVFSPALLSVWGVWDAADFPDLEGVWPTVETEAGLPAPGLSPSGDVISATSGTLPIVRLSSTSDDGNLFTPQTVTVREAYLLMKIREATFGGNDGIITGSPAPNNAFLVGKSGTNEFFDFGHAGTHLHELDDISYPQNAARAPMNQWGIVHIQNDVGVTLVNLQMGADRDFAGRYADLDIAYFIISEELFPRSTHREIMEFLSVLKGQLT